MGHQGHRPESRRNPRANRLQAPAGAPHSRLANRLDRRRLAIEFGFACLQRRCVRLGLNRRPSQRRLDVRLERKAFITTLGLILQHIVQPHFRPKPRRRLRLRLVAPAPQLARLRFGCEARLSLGCKRLIGCLQPVAGLAELTR